MEQSKSIMIRVTKWDSILYWNEDEKTGKFNSCRVMKLKERIRFAWKVIFHL